MMPTRVGAWAGLATAVLFAPMGLVVLDLPDLGSASGVADFYSRHGQLMEVILCSVSVGLASFLVFVAAVTERLRSQHAAAWTWVTFAGALMFMTALCVALGIDAAAVLLHAQVSAQTVLTLHSAAFLLAAPAAGAGIAFFLAVGAASFGGRGLPAWSGWLAVFAGAVNAGALAGFFSASGIWNAGNGLVGGLAGPVLAWLAWIVAISLSWLHE